MNAYSRKLAALFVCALLAILLSGCTVAPDNVQDPLVNFDVNAQIPFPTRAPVATKTPVPVQPTSAPVATSAPLSWQNAPGAGTSSAQSAPTRKPTPTPKPTPTLSPREEVLSNGSKGNNVTTLQKRLIELGYLSGGADGKYGAKTESAVSLFQKTMGLTETGTADLLTLKYLYANVKSYSEMVAEELVVSQTPKPSTQDGYPLLQRGDSGPDVTKLQTRLRKLGYLNDAADGDFGAVTEKAIKLFQKELGWEQTGVATSSLQSYIYSGSAPKYSGQTPAAPATKAPTAQEDTPTYKTLSPGDKNNDVKKLQKRLLQLGYFDGEIGGNYLTKTTSAVKRFQKALGLETTGVATPALQQQLFSDSAPSYTSAAATPSPSIPDTPATQGDIVKYGDSGNHVRQLQVRLIELGYLDAEATGNYLGKTEAAILLVQERLDLPKTGIVDKKLANAIFSEKMPPNVLVVEPAPGASSGDASDPNRVILQPGDTGSKVKKMQTALQQLGYFEGEIGGNYKTLTTEAVRTLQNALGYEETGVATYALMERLFDLSAPAYEQVLQYTALYPGDTGEAVSDLQLRLVALGFFPDYSSDIQGKFTKSTLAAVQLAQQMRGLSCLDDFASPEMQAYLFSDAAYFNSYVEIGG